MTNSSKSANDSASKEDSSDNVKFDFSRIKKIFNSKQISIILLILLILIPVSLTIYIRTVPQYLPATDTWAKNSVESYYKNTIVQQVNAQYPNLPPTQKQKLVDEQYSQFQKTNQVAIDEQITQTSAYFKTGFQYQENNNTYTFLGDLDSYYFLRFARNLQNKGTPCDEIIGNTCWDTHQYAPLGNDAGSAFMHPLGMFYTYKILNFLDPKINLMQAAFYLPTILAILAVISAFFIGRRLMNTVAGFFAAMFVALSPLLITRTLGSDTDIWNVMFPLMIIWLFLETLETKKLYMKMIFTGITGLLLGLFSFAWQGWWYIFIFMLVAMIAHLSFEIIKNKIHKISFKRTFEKLKTDLYILAVFLVSTMIFVTLFSSFSIFVQAFLNPVQISSNLKIATNADLWPNVYTTVAELNAASISTIVNQVSFGMNILFVLALMGIVFTLVKRKPDFKDYLLLGFSLAIYLYLISAKSLSMNPYLYLILLMIPVVVATIMLFKEKESLVDVKMAFLLMIWFVGMIYASQKGVRFILLLTPAFGIAVGVAIGYIYQYLSRIFNEDVKISDRLSKVIVFLLLCLILIAPIQIGLAAGKSYVPSMTKGWWDTLTKIKDESKPNAIINSWWDFGHWFKYAADRAVTLDGSGQNHPNAHWLGLTLQTNSQEESIAILRMLDCGSNNAFNEINKKYNDTEVSENIVSEMILMSKADAQKYLQSLGYSSAEITTILNLTHCDPPEDYFITSEDMVGKAGVWAHFGLWNFDKAFIINNVRGKPIADATTIMKERWNYTDEEASKIYYDVQTLQTDQEMNDWIAPWPSYATNAMVPCTAINDMILCDLNMNIGGNGQQNYLLERSVINISAPEKSQILIGVYDRMTNTKVGDSLSAFSTVAIADTQITKYNPANSTLGLAILLNVQRSGNTTSYSALVSDPLLIDSTFTKLFFLDGKYMDHFEKFSETTDITGSRIVVWKVKW